MDTEKAEVLLRVLEAGSLSAAAERLGYTPSGVSRIVAALEAETGFPLLRREHRGVRPTAECEQLLPHLHRLAAAQRQYDQEAAAILGLERGQLTVGSSYGSYVARLARAAAAFSREHPGIRVEIMTGSSTELGRALQEGRADLCVISRREGAFDWVPLQRDPLAAVVPADHPLAGGRAFPLERFSEEPFIDILPGEETDNSRLFREAHIQPRVRFACRDSLSALTMVEAGLGVTLVNALLLEGWRGKTAALPLSPPQEVEIGIAVPSLEAVSPAGRRFLALLTSEEAGPAAEAELGG